MDNASVKSQLRPPPYTVTDVPPYTRVTEEPQRERQRHLEESKVSDILRHAIVYVMLIIAFLSMIHFSVSDRCQQRDAALDHFEKCLCEPTRVVLVNDDLYNATTVVSCPSTIVEENIVSTVFNRTDIGYTCLYAGKDYELSDVLYSDLRNGNNRIAQYVINVEPIWWTQLLTWVVFVPLHSFWTSKMMKLCPFMILNVIFLVIAIAFTASPCLLN
jgi:hypothetical protein